MATMNRCEAEIDAIRDKLYEKYKHMTAAEHTRHVNEQTEKLAAQYGFTIGKPSSTKRTREATI
jgi:hypothetical protein